MVKFLLLVLLASAAGAAAVATTFSLSQFWVAPCLFSGALLALSAVHLVAVAIGGAALWGAFE
tara:strand:- start:23 stop:211 length:189 start_codon:yes stop_codon:yes gene_type:complete